ncbi:MAG: IS66 family transposase, partial [Planctomycetia bacterium]
MRRENAEQAAEIAELRKRVVELEGQLQKFLHRGKSSNAQVGRPKRTGPDRRTKKHRKHPGSFRADPPPDAVFTEHAVAPAACDHCGGRDLEPTGQVVEHVVAEMPEPKPEWHRYRHAVHRCRCCGKESKGVGELELPGAHIGPRARLFAAYARVHLGISLGKTRDLLHDYFGLEVSRAGLLGHLKWGGRLFAPVVEQLFELLRQSPVVGGDETGWRIDGKLAWAWCFQDPKLALFLIDRHRNRAVLEKALGESFPGTLVSDFYAVYNRLACRKQRCLVHLLREL